MTFLWPSMLWSLLFVPPVVGLYLFIQRRRRGMAAGFFRLSGARAPGLGWRRHAAPALFLLSLVILLAALARPQAKVSLPRVEGTVILVFDVSASMGAADVEPSRMEAAKAAAREFIESQPETVQIGIVSFSGSGFAVQMPTNDQTTLLAAVNRLEPTSGTSLGQGILAALNTIAVNAGLAEEQPPDAEGEAAAQGAVQNAPQQPRDLDDELLARLPEGNYPPSVIVLLSDGENNQSIDPLKAARAAEERGVRIDALGFGTTAGTILELEGFSVHTALDEATLQQIIETAGGSYYAAQGEQDTQAVYANLSPALVVKEDTMEITSIFSAAGILLLLVGTGVSLVWFNRLP